MYNLKSEKRFSEEDWSKWPQNNKTLCAQVVSVYFIIVLASVGLDLAFNQVDPMMIWSLKAVTTVFGSLIFLIILLLVMPMLFASYSFGPSRPGLLFKATSKWRGWKYLPIDLIILLFSCF